TGKELCRRRVDSPVYGGVFSPDGRLLAVGSPAFFKKKSAAVWGVVPWEPKVPLKVPEGDGVGFPLTISPDGQLVAGPGARPEARPVVHRRPHHLGRAHRRMPRIGGRRC